MALNLPNFLAAQPQRQDYAFGDILKRAFEGHQMAQSPSQMALEQEFKKAQIQKALMPQMGDFGKALSDRNRVVQQFGENSPEAQLANMFLQRKAEGQGGTEITVDPSGAISFSQGGRGGAKAGQQIIDNKVVQPAATPIIAEQQRADKAAKAISYIDENLKQPYSGSGSNWQLAKDRYEYDQIKDPEKKKQIGDNLVQAYVMQKLLPDIATTQLMSQNVNITNQSLKHQRESVRQGWAEILDTVVNNLPKELHDRGEKEYARQLEKLNKIQTWFQAQGFPKETKQEEKKVKKTINDYTLNDFQQEADKAGLPVDEYIKRITQALEAKKNNGNA